jgi:hypothetical protein
MKSFEEDLSFIFKDVKNPEESSMIARCKYTVRKSLPGKEQYDYEIIEAESVQDEVDGRKSGEDLMKECISLCRSSTAAAQQRRAATAAVKETETPKA